MMHLQATPYVPGRARGILRSGWDCVNPNVLLVVPYEDLKAFRGGCAGVIVVGGAPLSHFMIDLFRLAVPAVVLSQEQAQQLPLGTEAVLDGASGLVVSPDHVSELPPYREPKAPRSGLPVPSADGQLVRIRASLRDVGGAQCAVRYGAEAIGLVRSEFLCPASGEAPNEAFYREALEEVAQAVARLAMNVRLLDLAADKMPPWLTPTAPMRGALGLQGCRLYEMEPVRSVYQAQVRAIGALASQYDLRLLVPYVTRSEEFQRWRWEIERMLSVPMAVGTMIETPAAALSVRDWLELADFVAVGCNDLMQCFFGADRNIVEVGGLLDPYAPALFRLLRQVAVEAGDGAGNIQLCGLLAQMPGVLPVLLGLGFRIFSVAPVLIPHMAQWVAVTDIDRAEDVAAAVCVADDSSVVRRLLGLPEQLAWSA